MKKINLFDSNDRKVQVSLVRFFKFNNDMYFIYTLNEKDEKNYIKLYMVKVMEEFGRYLSYHISDDSEWQYTQTILKTILKEIKYNQERTFTDLNSETLNGMKIQKARIFKFEKDLVDLLTNEDKKIENNSQEKVLVSKPQPINTNEVIVDYKKKYMEAEEEIERLNEIMASLLAENVMYKGKYGEIENNIQSTE